VAQHLGNLTAKPPQRTKERDLGLLGTIKSLFSDEALGDLFSTPILAIAFYLLILNPVFAQQSETIHASYKYTLGDNDTKSDAKKIAFIEAKRLCLEKAGTYLESNTEVSEFRLSRDEVRTYAAGILKVEIVSEEFKATGENLTLFMEVGAQVDLREVKESLKRVKEDKRFADKIRKQETQLQALEDEIRTLQRQLSSNNFGKTAKIRQDRKAAFTKLDELEQIKAEIKSKTTIAIDNIELGMTPQEVIRIAGEPRSRAFHSFNYGNVWVIFGSGIVQCLVHAKDFSEGMTCYGYGPKKIK
jgi:hypothetical protein